MGDGTTISAFLSYHHADDRPVRRLQREIADLGDLRDHLASEATGVLVLVDTSALSTPNLNRFVRESITCGCLQDLVDTGGAAPTFTAGAVAGLPTGGGGPAFTCNAPSGQSGYALLANVAAPYSPLGEPLPNGTHQQGPGDAYPVGDSGTEPPRGNRRPGTFGFGIFTPNYLSGPEAGPVAVALPAAGVPRIVVAIDLVSGLRDDLLRLIDSMRAARCRTLVLVLAALARRPDARSFILVVVATSRCYGHRGEPADHALPARRSMSVVCGELVLVA